MSWFKKIFLYYLETKLLCSFLFIRNLQQELNKMCLIHHTYCITYLKLTKKQDQIASWILVNILAIFLLLAKLLVKQMINSDYILFLFLFQTYEAFFYCITTIAKIKMIQSGYIIEQSMKYLSYIVRLYSFNILELICHIITGCHNQTKSVSSSKLALLEITPSQSEQAREQIKLCLQQEYPLLLQKA